MLIQRNAKLPRNGERTSVSFAAGYSVQARRAYDRTIDSASGEYML